MKPYLLNHLQCPTCAGLLGYDQQAHNFACIDCGRLVPAQDEIPLFSEPPSGLAPSEKLPRSPDSGTPWRKVNWRFLQSQLAALPPGALILDVGAGRGDFAAAFAGRKVLALDVYPYPEVDLVCDLTQVNPLQPESFEAITLFNVLEHVADGSALFAALSRVLKPGGVLLVAVPFMVKIHQAPVDFLRYTHYALEQIGQKHGLAVEKLEGYYDPIFFLNEGIGNLRNSVIPSLSRPRRIFARLYMGYLQSAARLLGMVVGGGKLVAPHAVRSQAPTGYHVVYRKTTP